MILTALKSFQQLKLLKRNKAKCKDYKISPKDRPLNMRNIKNILFKGYIRDAPFRCPCQKVQDQFWWFNAQEWITKLELVT